MKRLRGVKEINDCIEKYIKKWHLKARLSTDFCYFPSKRVVCWTLLVSEKNDKDFSNFFESLGCKVKADIFIYSLLHEIGHSQTLFLLSDEEYNYSHDRADDKTITNEEYFNLPNEIIATKWAVEYLNDHAEEVNNFWSELQPKILKFYAKNHIL